MVLERGCNWKVEVVEVAKVAEMFESPTKADNDRFSYMPILHEHSWEGL